MSIREELKEEIVKDLTEEAESTLSQRFKTMLTYDIYVDSLHKYEDDISVDSQTHLEVIKDVCSSYGFSLIKVRNKYYICNDLEPDSKKFSKYLISDLKTDILLWLFVVTVAFIILCILALTVSKLLALLISVIYLTFTLFYIFSSSKVYRSYKALNLVVNNGVFKLKS